MLSYQVNKLVNNALYKNNLTLPVLTSVDIIKESTSENEHYILKVLNKKVTNQLPFVIKKFTK